MVLAGQPNVGKSSLLNALAGAELAIVTPIAGTTRDKVAQTIQIEGIPLHVIDTAGLRETEDEVEKIGIARTWSEIERADVVLHLLDARTGMTVEDDAIAARFPGGVPVRARDEQDGSDGPRACRAVRSMADAVDLQRSAAVGETGRWRRAAARRIAAHRRLASRRGKRLPRARAASDCSARGAGASGDGRRARGSESQALDLFAEELRLAQDQLNSITGEFSSDDLLGVIFSRFCIGK